MEATPCPIVYVYEGANRKRDQIGNLDEPGWEEMTEEKGYFSW